MALISGIYPKVRIEAPGVPEPLLEDVVGAAIEDFFRESEAWRHTTTTLLDWTTALPFPALTAGTELPADTRLHRVDVVKYGAQGANLRPVPFHTRQDLDCIWQDWEIRTSNTPEAWTNDPNGAAPRLVPAADADQVGVLQVRSIVVPTSSMTDINDYFYEEFHDAWRWGALARLLKMPGRDWTNLSLAAFYERKEEDAQKMAKSQAEAEYGQPNRRVMAYGGL